MNVVPNVVELKDGWVAQNIVELVPTEPANTLVAPAREYNIVWQSNQRWVSREMAYEMAAERINSIIGTLFGEDA